MKRDMDLIRRLLIEIETLPPGTLYETDASSIAADRPQLEEHLALLAQAGFLNEFSRELSGNALCSGLSWQGHDFLSVARSDAVWRRAKKKLLTAGVGVSVTLLKDLLVTEARRQLGLPDE